MRRKNLERLSEIVGDAYYDKANKLSVLSAALDFVTRGTIYREDAIDIIKGCYPDYFNEPNGRIDATYEVLKQKLYDK